MAVMKPRQLSPEELAESNRKIVAIYTAAQKKKAAREARRQKKRMENETVPAEAVQPDSAPDLRGQMVAKQDQLRAALQENAGVIQQMERELEQRRAAQHQLFGSLKTLGDLLGPPEAAPG